MAVPSETDRDRLLRLCAEQQLPEVVESTSYGSPCLRVRGKSFVSLRGPQELVLHCPVDHKELLMDIAPEIYWQTPHFHGWPGLLVRLEVIGDEELALRLADAWRFRAPRRLAAQYARDHSPPA